MNIALLGYGRMGKEIEKIAIARGHTIGLKINNNQEKITLDKIDVAIDFSLPKAAFHNIKTCINNNTPVVSGTTGWLEDYDKILDLCKEENGTFLYASNFSLGVNIFFKLNQVLAKLMKPQPQFTTEITEIHHTDKLDAPSGTAISLAEDIIAQTDYETWTMGRPQPKEISIVSERIPDVPGTHVIDYKSKIDTISISHKAHNRSGFALGAVIAAEFIVGKQGVFTMKDVLNLG